MSLPGTRIAFVLLIVALLASVRHATADPIPIECATSYTDFGDAPEGVWAYPSLVYGWFPTCLAPTIPPTPSVQAFCAPLSTGTPIGFVKHVTRLDQSPFWLGCAAPRAVDSEPNGKSMGVGMGPACDPAVTTDCSESAFGFLVGQDECAGDGVDAGVIGPFTFEPCLEANLRFNAYNCGPDRVVYLNVLADWNEDGDWFDNFECPAGIGCVYEWALQNVPIVLAPGCNTLTAPAFRAGPFGSRNGWMRVSISEDPAPADFPWNGTVSLADSAFSLGETEDYPIGINGPPGGCAVMYRDYGDAPEDFPAYPSGVIGRFPSCQAATAAGDLDAFSCEPPGTRPGLTGRVIHLAAETDPTHFWMGCGGPPTGVDFETDAKTSSGGQFSACDGEVPVDCFMSAFGGSMTFGQDECPGDNDSGVELPDSWVACERGSVRMNLYNCSPDDLTVHANVLVDWNEDGDWNDVLQCPGPECTPEWAVKNLEVTLAPGCNTVTTPLFRIGHIPGSAWMRVTTSLEAAPDDFPWNGSVSLPSGVFHAGETEDHVVEIQPGSTAVDPNARPSNLWLATPEPNPSSDGVILRFGLSRRGVISLAVYDLAGRRVAGLANGVHEAGPHSARWNHRDASGRTVPLGMYLVRLEAEGRVLTQRAIRIR